MNPADVTESCNFGPAVCGTHVDPVCEGDYIGPGGVGRPVGTTGMPQHTDFCGPPVREGDHIGPGGVCQPMTQAHTMMCRLPPHAGVPVVYCGFLEPEPVPVVVDGVTAPVCNKGRQQPPVSETPVHDIGSPVAPGLPPVMHSPPGTPMGRPMMRGKPPIRVSTEETQPEPEPVVGDGVNVTRTFTPVCRGGPTRMVCDDGPGDIPVMPIIAPGPLQVREDVPMMGRPHVIRGPPIRIDANGEPLTYPPVHVDAAPTVEPVRATHPRLVCSLPPQCLVGVVAMPRPESAPVTGDGTTVSFSEAATHPATVCNLPPTGKPRNWCGTMVPQQEPAPATVEANTSDVCQSVLVCTKGRATQLDTSAEPTPAMYSKFVCNLPAMGKPVVVPSQESAKASTETAKPADTS